jgi:serine O-acetyltransferase
MLRDDGKPAGCSLPARRAPPGLPDGLYFAGLQRHIIVSMSAEQPGLWELIREDFEAHGRDATRPGFQAVAVYRFGVWRMNVEPKLLRAPFSVLYRALYRSVRNFYGIELPYSAKIGRRVIFEHQHGIVVHGETVIGDDCIIRQGVTLGIRNMDKLAEAPVLGRGVNVGAGAKIIGAVNVGDGAAIGANAVVLKDVPAGALAIGVPAQLASRKNGASVTDQPLDERIPKDPSAS